MGLVFSLVSKFCHLVIADVCVGLLLWRILALWKGISYCLFTCPPFFSSGRTLFVYYTALNDLILDRVSGATLCFYSSRNTSKDSEVPQDKPWQSVTTDSSLPAYIYEVCKLRHSGSQPRSFVIAKTHYLHLFLSLPSSSFFLHITLFLSRCPPERHSWCLRTPNIPPAVVSSFSQPALLDWASMGTALYLVSNWQECLIQHRIPDECTPSKLLLIFPLQQWVRIS